MGWSVCVCLRESLSFQCLDATFPHFQTNFCRFSRFILIFYVFPSLLEDRISRCVVPPPVWLSFHLLFFSFFCLSLSFFRVSVSLLLSLSVSACQFNFQLHTHSYLPLSFSLSQGLIMVEMPPPSRDSDKLLWKYKLEMLPLPLSDSQI